MTRFGRLMVWLFGRNVPAKFVAERKSHTLLEIPRPWPRPLRGRPVRGRMRVFGFGPWSRREDGSIYNSWPFVRLGRWREWYFPDWLVVWRKGDRVWMTFWPLWHLRDWLFTRCEGCGKRIGWGKSPVCTLEWQHRAHTKSIMVGRTGRYHHGCAQDPAASQRATQEWDRQWGHDIKLRQSVLNEPIEVALELAAYAGMRRDADRLYLERLTRSRRERMDGEFRWKFPRVESGVGDDA